MGYKISLGLVNFGTSFPKFCRTNFVTPKLQMKSIVYSTIEKKDNFFPPKLDTIQKHVGCPQAVVAIIMLLSMSGFITSMHLITKTRGFTQEKEIFTQILLIVKVHTLIKFVQHQDVFIVEFMDVIQLTKAKLLNDAFLNPLLNPLEGSTMYSCEKLGLGGHS